MPKTKFQEFIFTIIMVIVMVYALCVYNISLDKGGLTNEVLLMALAELIIMGIIAFIVEFFFVSHLAQKLAFTFVKPSDCSLIIILAISAMTVCLMCPMMSFVSTLLFKGVDTQLIAKWIQTTIINFPMAFFWQIFIAGPLVRKIFAFLFDLNKSMNLKAQEN